jgi:hypothetical protein
MKIFAALPAPRSLLARPALPARLTSLALLILLILTALTLEAPDARASRLKVIDAHTHTDYINAADPLTGIMDTRDEYLSELSKAGVVASVSLMSPEGLGYDAELLKHNVIFCYGLNDHPDYAAAEEGLKSGKYKCLKIYLGYYPLYPTDQAYQPAYQLARKYKIPVVFHTGDTDVSNAHIRYADPLPIDDVAVANPDIKLVIAHLGNPWIASAAEVVYKNPNVFADGSALMIGNMSKLKKDEVREYVIKPLRWAYGYVEDPSKIMFGTDWPLNDIPAYLDAFKKAIPKELWKEVFCTNAVHVFNLDPKLCD